MIYLLSGGVGSDFNFVDGELNGLGGGFGAQVVHPCLEPQLPAVEVHRAHLAKVRFGNVNVEGLGLVDVGAPVGGLLQHVLLADLPHGLVQVADLLRNLLIKYLDLDLYLNQDFLTIKT